MSFYIEYSECQFCIIQCKLDQELGYKICGRRNRLPQDAKAIDIPLALYGVPLCQLDGPGKCAIRPELIISEIKPSISVDPHSNSAKLGDAFSSDSHDEELCEHQFGV